MLGPFQEIGAGRHSKQVVTLPTINSGAALKADRRGS